MILKISDTGDDQLLVLQKVRKLSAHARRAAQLSAQRSKLAIERFDKDDSGVPLPVNGVWWSISHKPGAVAGVVSCTPVGIDIEQLKPVSKALFDRILEPDERRLFKDDQRPMAFFRGFTAKEAVLKMNGSGISALASVKIHSVVDETNLEVVYQGNKVLVENFIKDGYLASVTKNNSNVCWAMA